MAKRRKEMAEYECISNDGCVLHIQDPSGLGTVEQLFTMFDADLGIDNEANKFSHLRVEPGTIVCKWFEPLNDTAWDDRDGQIKNPGKYCTSENDVLLLSEIMVAKGFFKNKEEANAAIREDMKNNGLEKTDHELRIEMIEKLSAIGSDDKESRRILSDMLKDSDVTFFRGARPEKLAELVVDNGLYEGS